jgi:hypothetical protein
MRPFTNTLFGLALSSALMLKSFAIQNELVGLAVFSVLLSAILTHFPLPGYYAIWFRPIAIAGIGGLSLIYMQLGGSSLPGTILTVLTAVLVSCAVLLAIYADLSTSKNGEEKQHEV